MMTLQNIVEYLSAEPFRPFRIKMASGQVFEVRHPEMLLAGRSSVRIFTPPEAKPPKPPQWHDVSLMLMETLESLEAKTTLGKNA